MQLMLMNHKEAYKKKSQESLEFQKKVRELGDEIYEIETKYAGLEAKHKRCHSNQEKEFEVRTRDLRDELRKLGKDHEILQQSYQKLANLNGNKKDSYLLGEIERLKSQHNVDLSKLELIIAELENKYQQTKLDSHRYQRELDLSRHLAERCDILEKDSLMWVSERDKLIAKYTTAIEMMKKEYEAELLMAIETLQLQLGTAVKEGQDKQREIEALMVRLEHLESTRSTDVMIIEDIHRRYKLQIH